MGSRNEPFSELINLLNSWIPWRSEPSTVSRDFWMPDKSCRVCYECDSQFTIFNRRHHCRICGRVFCAKCTNNSIPIPSTDPGTREELERIRVCSYCFKQWQQDTTSFNNGNRVPNLDHSPPLAASFTSSKSSRTAASNFIIGSNPYTCDSYGKSPCYLGPNPYKASEPDSSLDKRGELFVERNIDYPSPKQYAYSTSRSDDEDVFGIYQSDSEIRNSPIATDYYHQDEFYDFSNDETEYKSFFDEEGIETKSFNTSPFAHSFGSQGFEGEQPIEKKDGHGLDYECTTSPSMYCGETDDNEPVDFENNGLLWLPPEPEDEEDEREHDFSDDDDDYYGDNAREWRCLRSSSSFGSEELRSSSRSTEEQKKAMKNAVDGHFRALVAQLLLVENVSIEDENEKESWLEIITSLSWEAATLLKPDMSNGGGMDPGGYVKVKCIASGHKSESMVVKGVLCKKNVAHRRMRSRIEKPRLLILGGALEYQRVTNHLLSVDTLLQQETEHLKMTVAKIDAHRPDILLVERSVSRYAQEHLLNKNISLVLNIKRPLLERIARCTGAQIVPSIDRLSSPKLGYCDLFHVERYSENLYTSGSNGKKTVKNLMWFEGCPKPLGFTVLLRGAGVEELKKVKHVVQYGVFAAYHLAVETSFLADEGASMPDFSMNSPISVDFFDISTDMKKSIYVPSNEPQRSNSVPAYLIASELNKVLVDKGECQSSVDYPIYYSKDYVSSYNSLTSVLPKLPRPPKAVSASNHTFEKSKTKLETSLLEEISTVNDNLISMREHLILDDYEHSKNAADNTDPEERKESHTHNCELPYVNLECKTEVEETEEINEGFPSSPSDHQSILVSLSTRCVWKGTVCERSHIFRIKYYGNFDKPLGRFLRDNLFDQSYICNSCEMPSEAHVNCYTHQQSSLVISVKKLPEILLQGEQDGKIWMWHRCLRCPRTNGFPPATRRVVMSDAAWGFSFGKFLELSFSNNAAASRVASCGHSLHRDCLRFYGFGKMVACFRYATIDVLSVYLPPLKVDFNSKNQEWIEKEKNEVVNWADIIFYEVLNALKRIAEERSSLSSFKSGAKLSESKRQIADLEAMLQKEKAELEESLQKILNKEVKGQHCVDILEINRLRRQLLFQSYMWDHRLVYAASLHNNLLDGVSSPISGHEEKPPTDVVFETDVEQMKGHVSGDCRRDEKLLHHQQEPNVECHWCDSNDEELFKTPHSCHIKEDGPILSHSLSTRDPYTDMQPNASIRRTLSEGQVPVMSNISDTLDAAWMHGKVLGTGLMDDNTKILHEPDATGTLVSAVGTECLDLEDQSHHKGNHSLLALLSSKASDTSEESISWLKVPFLNFYRALNKNLRASFDKLDTLGEYKPVYVSSFRELELQFGARLLLPAGISDIVIPVYDDEPSSIISYVLLSPEYHAQLPDEVDKFRDSGEFTSSFSSSDAATAQSFQSLEELPLESYKSLGSIDESFLSSSRASLISDPLFYTKGMHIKASFTDDGLHGKVRHTVTCYYAKQFESLRRICCPSELDYVRSISRCKKWSAQGGKSNVFFAKTLDDRFIIKQVTKTELESFIKFAPGYFKYLSESIRSRSPTCLAKILGIYQVTSKHLKGGKETKMDLLVMENLLFERTLSRLYDLKGSSRSRYNADSSGKNKVLLDQNLIESMPTSPIFLKNKAKRVLERAVWNDTSFLASVDVMDYSLLVGIDEENHELVFGIIDFMRQYTWDKHLETWVKASGILGGPKNVSPTVISPKQYKKRFRKAMTTYFLMVPDQWSSQANSATNPSTANPSRSQSDYCGENSLGAASVE